MNWVSRSSQKLAARLGETLTRQPASGKRLFSASMVARSDDPAAGAGDIPS